MARASRAEPGEGASSRPLANDDRRYSRTIGLARLEATNGVVPEVRGILPGHGDARDAKACFEIVGGHVSVAHAGAEGDGAHGVRQ